MEYKIKKDFMVIDNGIAYGYKQGDTLKEDDRNIDTIKEQTKYLDLIEEE